MVIRVDGEWHSIVEYQHVKPGKGSAFMRTKLRNINTSATIDKTFRTDEKFERAIVERKPMHYLYSDDFYHFMDTETYENIALNDLQLGDARLYIKENMTIDVVFCDGLPIGVELPAAVELKVIRTEPGVRGDTVSGGSKPATLETNTVVQVPLFIGEGDIVKIDTRTGEYLGRA